MARRYNFGGDVTNTPNIGYPGTYVYTSFPSGFPVGNKADNGTYPIKTYNVGADYLSGAGHVIVVAGGVDVKSQLVSSTGGGFQMRIYCDSGYIVYGRNENDNSLNVNWSGGGVEWPGASLPGWMDWATVCKPPTMRTPITGGTPGAITVQFDGSSDNGGDAVDAWGLQYADNPGMTGAVTINSSGTSHLVLTPGKKYYFRSRGHNDVGWSAWSSIVSGTTRAAGGKRWNGSAWVASTIGKRWNGTAWVDLSTRKRWNGSAWVDLTN